jgi:hypothetical protein
VTYRNLSTERLALWVGTDPSLVRALKHTASDETGVETELAVRGIFNGRFRLSPEQGVTARRVRDEVSLADVAWREVRDEIDAVDLG